jgi:hypothetical protein
MKYVANEICDGHIITELFLKDRFALRVLANPVGNWGMHWTLDKKSLFETLKHD